MWSSRPMLIIGLDPGPTESAWCILAGGHVRGFAKASNGSVIALLAAHRARALNGDVLAIERIASYGMAVGASVFETCFESGRFVEAWGGDWINIYRKDVKLHLCGSMKANDSNIRQALIDRWGGKEKAIGRKAQPGPLYGMHKDCWSALAIAVTAAERGQNGRASREG